METTTDTNQQACTPAEPQQEHRWLEKFVGEWTFESECDMEPGKPREKFKGKQSTRSIGGLWIVGEGLGEMPGGGMGTMVLTLGYDPQKKRYVGTWFGSMMTALWVYEGERDAAGNVLTLNTEGPSFAGDGTLSKYRDIIEVKSDDHYVLHSTVQGEGGKWTEFMVANYRRKR
jgi:hypothetical protein